MCLEVQQKDRKPLVATKDINVYKVLAEGGWGPIFTLYIQGLAQRYEKGYHYTETTPFKGRECHRPLCGDGWHIKIGRNAFHSLKTREGAENLMVNLKRIHTERHFKIVRMTIPKGAKYYESGTGYASSEIIYY